MAFLFRWRAGWQGCASVPQFINCLMPVWIERAFAPNADAAIMLSLAAAGGGQLD